MLQAGQMPSAMNQANDNSMQQGDEHDYNGINMNLKITILQY